MSRYEVRRSGRERQPFDDYAYDVFLDGAKVAEITHDFRGEDLSCSAGGESFWLVALRGVDDPLSLDAEDEAKLDALLGRG